MKALHPQILQPTKNGDWAKLQKLLKSSRVVDAFEEQLEELFLVRHPQLKLNPAEAKKQVAQFLQEQKKKPITKQGTWVYFEWNNTLVHILNENDFFELRSARNHNLVTKKEQKALQDFRIGIAGLSVGNSVALALALEGAETIRLADFDELSLSNLNRIRGSVTQLGLNKTEMTARHIYEVNPYAKLALFKKGLPTQKELMRFIAGEPKLQILIDEMDDVIMKIQLRKIAKSVRIPVVSVADNGTNAICDIERFDLEPQRPLFHGLVKNIENLQLDSMDFAERIKIINNMVGLEYVVPRMKQSLLEIGTTLYSWPQLGGAAMLSGSTIVYTVKKIVFCQKLESGKYDVNFDRIFDKQYDSPKSKQRRSRETKEFLSAQNRIFS